MDGRGQCERWHQVGLVAVNAPRRRAQVPGEALDGEARDREEIDFNPREILRWRREPLIGRPQTSGEALGHGGKDAQQRRAQTGGETHDGSG
ncbi:hypothetical protein [Sphingomonas sp.]|uniref:hypothetical protein n=1 Tax=Sphingomonas sp. TaxID=28214 RepID=UPI0038ACA5C6